MPSKWERGWHYAFSGKRNRRVERSSCRRYKKGNQDLANVFYRLHLIEAYGTGMGKFSAPKAESIAGVTAGAEKILSNEERVLEYARSHGVITRNDVIELLEVSTSTASRVIRKMVKSNLLKRNGKADLPCVDCEYPNA